jgi:hypothetical protein
VQSKHQVSCDGASDPAYTLRAHVTWQLTPRQTALHRIYQADGRIEMSARNWAKREYQGNEGRARRYGISKQGDSHVSA